MYELTEEEKRRCLLEARRELGLLPEPPKGWVEIEYPPTRDAYLRERLEAPPNATAVVTEDAYRLVWYPKGWRKVLRP